MHRCSLPLRLISINCLHVGQSRHETSFPHLLQTLDHAGCDLIDRFETKQPHSGDNLVLEDCGGDR
jgi:hypothetical protein